MTTSNYLFPILYTVFVWWFSTGAILYIVGLRPRTFKWSMLAATALLVLALAGLYVSKSDASVSGAYLAFSCALAIWAWQEIGFLLGYVTGPRREACPDGAAGWPRAGFAFQAVLHHEMGLLALGVAVLALTWGGSNLTGLWTFLVLWVMRQSAKLNIFLGVRNLYESFLPNHLKYMHTYFSRKAMNPLFPVSIVLGTVGAWFIWQGAFAQGSDSFEATSLTFVAILLSLAVLEHWFLVIPFPSEALWSWGMRSRDAPSK